MAELTSGRAHEHFSGGRVAAIGISPFQPQPSAQGPGGVGSVG